MIRIVVSYDFKKLHQYRVGHCLMVERNTGKINERSRRGREEVGRREQFFPYGVPEVSVIVGGRCKQSQKYPYNGN